MYSLWTTSVVSKTPSVQVAFFRLHFTIATPDKPNHTRWINRRRQAKAVGITRLHEAGT